MTSAAVVYGIFHAVHAPTLTEPAKAGSESDKKAVAAAIADPLKATLQKWLLVFIERCASFQRRRTDQGPVR
jgi:hypothetical protein